MVCVKKKDAINFDGLQTKVQHVAKVNRHILVKLANSMVCKILWIGAQDVGLWPNTTSLRWRRTIGNKHIIGVIVLPCLNRNGRVFM